VSCGVKCHKYGHAQMQATAEANGGSTSTFGMIHADPRSWVSTAHMSRLQELNWAAAETDIWPSIRDVVIATHPRQKLNGSDGLRTIGAQPGTEAEPALVPASPLLSVVRGMLRYVHW